MKTQRTKTKWIEYGSRFNVAGVQYSDYLKASKMKLGDRVRFIGEPTNTFDKRAVRIEWKGIKIGYVPSRSAQQHGLWSEHGAQSVIIGVITAINKNNPTWNLYTVQILVKRKPTKVTKKQGEVNFAQMRAILSYMEQPEW